MITVERDAKVKLSERFEWLRDGSVARACLPLVFALSRVSRCARDTFQRYPVKTNEGERESHARPARKRSFMVARATTTVSSRDCNAGKKKKRKIRPYLIQLTHYEITAGYFMQKMKFFLHRGALFSTTKIRATMHRK